MHRVDLTDLARIAEAHFTDVHGAAMKRFHDKYKDAGPEFFVNFNPVVSDPRDKTILGQQMDVRKPAKGQPDHDHPLYKKPDHNDPVGTYAYPAEYVANHWHDLQYGSGMANLRVMKVSLDPEKTLRLDDMSEEYFVAAMKRLNIEYHVSDHGWLYTRNKHDALMLFDAVFDWEAPASPHHRVNAHGKVLFKLIQNDYRFSTNVPDEDEDGDDEEGGDEDTGYSSAGDFKYKGHLKVQHVKELSQIQQTRRLLKAGYDVVLDRAKTPLEATIYPAEPEQIICLTKRSYEVVETFKLGSDDVGTEAVEPSEETQKKTVNKAGWLIAKSLGAPISESVKQFFNGKTKIRNLRVLRHWIATEKIEQQDASMLDPTFITSGEVSAWVTTRGQLIVIEPMMDRSSRLEDPAATKRTQQSVSKALVRPGEDEASIADNLKSYAETSLDKPAHRKYGAHNAMIFFVGLVTEAAEPVFIRTEVKDSVEDIPKKMHEALAKQAAKAPFRRITSELLAQFVKDAKKKIALVKPTAGPAAAASPQTVPSATPAAPDGTAAHPTP